LSAGIKAIPVVSTVAEIIEKIDDELRDEKLQILLASFAERFDSAEDALNKLKELASTREGAILFRKLIQIMDNGDLDAEWLGVLSTALKKITDADLKAQFREIVYALGQIDRLTPQALIILSKYYKWSGVRIQGTTTASRQTTSGDWDVQAVSHWLPSEEPGVRTRIAHAFRELMSTGLITLNQQQIALEPIGDEVFRYVSKEREQL